MDENSDTIPTLYFGYGSNLDWEDWTKWCQKKGHNPSGLKEIGPAWLDGYYLCFDYYSRGREGGAANLRPLASGRIATPGALFEISPEALAALDQKEGHPLAKYYQREIVTVHTEDGKQHTALTYIHHAKEDNFFAPTKEYESLIRNNLERLDLPTKFLDVALAENSVEQFEHVFVYGTLMNDQSRHSELKNDSDFICEGRVRGELYKIRDYPGLINGDDIVHGEVYRAKDMFQLIQRLDWIEGATGENPLFKRAILQVDTEQGPVWAYTYHYAQSVDSSEKIDSGDWKSFN